MKKKIESIRSQYRRELRKQEKSKKSGAGADDIYTPILWCFDDLCFINDGNSKRESVSSMDSQVSHVPEEVCDHEVSTLLPPPGGYVFIVVCLFVCLFVCLSVRSL